MAPWTQRKSIGLALGVVAAIVSTGLVYQLTRSTDEPSKPILVALPHAATDGSSKGAVLEKPALEAEAAQATERVERISAARQTSDELTVFHIAVATASGTPITSGSIECDWRGQGGIDAPLTGRVQAQISGASTEVILPLAAERCIVSAFSPGHSPAQVLATGFRRLQPNTAALTGRVDHNVRVVLDLGANGPTLSGSISVNGERRVPDGMRIIVNSVIAKTLLDRAGSSYSVSEFHPTPTLNVRVESDETPLRVLVTPPAGTDGNYRLDLALESKGALFVHAIDDASGKPAGGVALTLQQDTVTERTLKRTTRSQHAVRKTTDEHGDCVFRGIPDEGKLMLRETKDESSGEKALWSLELVRESPPADLHETVRVNALRASVWGTIPAPSGSGPGLSSSYTVVRARAPEPGRQVFDGDDVSADAEGRWSFDCATPSEWLVWLTQNDTRVSEVERVVVDRAKPYGPIQFVMTTTHDVNLHMTHLPPSGRVSMFVSDEAGGPSQLDSFEISTQDLVRVLHLHGPAGVSMICSVGSPGSKTHTQQSLRIDPEESQEVFVDWHNERARKIEVLLNGSILKGEALIALMNLDGEGELGSESTAFDLDEGKSDQAMPLPGGTYIYAIMSDVNRGALYGILRVPDSAEPSLMKVAWSGKSLPREALGTGIALTTLDGVSCAKMRQSLREVLWPKNWGPEVTTLLVPDQCEYSVMK